VVKIGADDTAARVRDKEDRGADDLIERATCGLRNSENPTSDNQSPQETTEHDPLDMGTDGAELSCPGSSEVADKDDGHAD
jgi:hypothetical protein